jgi:hypothetical protein
MSARYLSIVRGAENQGTPPQALLDAMGRFIEASLRDGTLVQTGGLAAGGAAVRVGIRDGQLVVRDGPFAESKEIVGGYAILEAGTREAALESVRAFMRLHQEHWPEWQGECELREIAFLAP